MWLQSFEGASDLFRLRQLQSKWYMEMFQSGREPWPDPYPYVWKSYAAMSQWLHNLPESTPPATRTFFTLELLYSYVYILSPSPRIPQTGEYAQRLIFEHCISYAATLLSITSKPVMTASPPVTSFDAMRACMTGRAFLDVLVRNPEGVLNPNLPDHSFLSDRMFQCRISNVSSLGRPCPSVSCPIGL